MAVTDKAWLTGELEMRGVSRTEFLKFCVSMAAILGLPRAVAAKLPDAIATAEKPTLIWLGFQDCAGNTESFLRASHPTIAELILDLLSLDYHETLMAAAGFQAEAARAHAVAAKRGEYIAVVEGSIPTGAGGAYCTIGGRSALQIAQEVCGGAAATIAIGTCAAFGGLPAASPNPTNAVAVGDAVPGIKNLINLSACPANVENVTALLVHYMTTKRWPDLDSLRRPLFAYGTLIHENCQRRAHFDNGQYVENWGDEGHRLGYCLYKMGCKGPVTAQNCPIVRWNETSWPIGCGHPCVGCAEPNFWDANTPFYRHLEGVPGSGMGSRIDLVGLGVASGVAALFVAHGVAQAVRNRSAAADADEEKG